MTPERRTWNLWRAALALVVAIALIAVVMPDSTMSRFTNLALGDTGFRDTYLMFSKSEPGKGYVVNRRDSTIRRSYKKLPGGKWNIFEIGGSPDMPSSSVWLVQAKRKNTGTAFFVPVTDVDDWSYPFLYQFVRKHRKDFDLPNVEWSRLFVNRIYQGLYLKVALPFDLRKKDGGNGILREIFTIQDDRMTYVNTRFDDAPGLYATNLANGVDPQLTPPPPALAWLSQHCPTDGTTALLSDQPSHALSLLPLPISLPDLFAAKNGRLPASFEDDRFRQWSARTQRSNPGDPLPFTDAELAALVTEFEQYAVSFRTELRMHIGFHHMADLQAQLPERQAAIAQLRLRLGQL